MKHLPKVCFLTIALCSFSYEKISAEPVKIDISYAELIDKITILKIKSERITDPEKLKNVLAELALLLKTAEDTIGPRTDIAALMQELKAVNETLWDIEDLIRIKERIQDFGDEFIELARNVYRTNDQRFMVKKKIDMLLGSSITEEKSYEGY